MIDFKLLNRLMSSARNPSAGKPLDKVRSLCKRGYRGGNEMRNCRLFKTNDTNWRVELHGNTIAHITQLDDGCAQITIHNIASWPTNTTAARLTAVLDLPVWKQNNKLRAYPKNCKAPRSAVPPLVDGLMFHSGPAGVVCMNPEIITERRTRILKEPSKPILAYLREVKKLAKVYIKLGSPTYKDLAPHINSPMELDIETAPDMEVVMQIMAAGARKRLGPWRVKDFAERDLPISEDSATGDLELGLRYAKDMLYSQHGVYEKYTHSFADQFEEVRHGSNTPLAQAA